MAPSHYTQAPESPENFHSGRFRVGGPYAKYVLLLLIFVYAMNLLDRQILAILAGEIQADLGINDSQMGFLYGTSYAVFYAVFGWLICGFAKHSSLADYSLGAS